ncbi:hypothetical protein [Kitasatospora cineracea]|uniref:hypothetical protein n=1 Tax=Kitasatospora cineracea TaxID=88074 RepID=UPI00381C3F9A
MRTPHEPYFRAVLDALGNLAHDAWAEHCCDNAEVMLTEIRIDLYESGGPEDGGWFLFWNQVTGWQCCLVEGDNVAVGPDQFILGDVPTPASVAAAARALVSDEPDHLPAAGEETPITDRPLTPALAAALLLPVPSHVLVAPTVAVPGREMTVQAKAAVKALVVWANAHAHLVNDLLAGAGR